ncbi:MAG: hypothetical protein HGA44_02815, partial [Cellulomonadaceae bacterium]|nr:hypothetical protein [Cellulomonadaceae bacterium]
MARKRAGLHGVGARSAVTIAVIIALGATAVIDVPAVAASASAGDPVSASSPTSRELIDVGTTTPLATRTLELAHDSASSAMPSVSPAEVSWPAADVLTLAEGSSIVTSDAVDLRRTDAAAASDTVGDVTVRVLDRSRANEAGVDGVLFTITTPEEGDAVGLELSVDYSGFAEALGADWSSRLQLVSMPACVLDTPEAAECQVQTPVGSTNDTARSTVVADIGAADLAVSSGAEVTPDSGQGPSPEPSASPSGNDATPSPGATGGGESSAPGPSPTTDAPTESSPSPDLVPSPEPEDGTVGKTPEPTTALTHFRSAVGSGPARRPATRSARSDRLAGETTSSPSVGVMALTAAASGPSGNWGATPLTASSSWQVSPQTGDFTWSYPFSAPPAAAGPEPELALSYSSGSLDGKIAGQNTQSSWVGDGWDLSPGFIERRYVSCSQDATTAGANNVAVPTGDLCWGGFNGTIAFGGHSGELVKDASTGAWKLKGDDGTRVQLLSGSGNGDDNGEYWKVTTTDGTEYYFGQGRRSPSDPLQTDSAWTVPVYGNNPDEPCYSISFAASICDQAWRWNLDYVVDPSSNSMTYTYSKEVNRYEPVMGSGVSSYTRGGYLTRVDYGQRAGSESENAPQRVEFAVTERCLPSGAITCDPAQLSASTASSWPDVPFDLICESTTACPQLSPSFFTRKRLSTVTTKVWTGSAYQPVDSWSLAQTFPDPGDATSPALWLSSVQQQGLDGTAITAPKVQFTGVQMANRVDTTGDAAPPMNRYRISAIDTDSGGKVSVNYTSKDCSAGDVPASPDANTRRCFPVLWMPEGTFQAPVLEYFHKYLVTSVVANAGALDSSVPVETRYSYVGAPAWHYDDNPLVAPAERTWGEFRGFDTVEVVAGAASSTQTRSRMRYFRGMNGDKLISGTRSVTIDSIPDDDQLSGFMREQITFDGSAEVSGVRSTPWSSVSATAADGTRAFLVETMTTESRVTAPARAGGLLSTRTDTAFDTTYGLPIQVDDQGDITTAADDRCTRLEYARNVAANITGTVSRSETVGASCATARTQGDAVSDTRTLYDGGAFGAAPTRGLVTGTQELSGFDGVTPSYATSATAAYDALGRVTAVSDALGRISRTEYTPSAGGPLTRMVTISPDPDGSGPATPLETTTDIDPERGTPSKQADPNGKVISATQDALGRTTQVWFADRKQGVDQPSATYEYSVNVGGMNAVTTRSLTAAGTYQTSVVVYDGLLRPRQSQSPSAARDQRGRVVTDTLYDSRGLVAQTNDSWFTAGDPGVSIVVPTTAVPSRTRYVYDGAGRQTAEIFDVYEQERWRTTTTYGGDRTSVDPPTGGVPTTTVVDARGRTTELWQYSGPTPTGDHQAVNYTYDSSDQLVGVTDSAGLRWTYGYDLLGRQTSSNDPDKGATSTTYDAADQVISTTDARGVTLVYAYDALGRPTELREGSATGPLRTSSVYDTLAKGQLTSSTRHDWGSDYTTAVTAYDDAYRPLGQLVTLPPVEGVLAGTYTTKFTYAPDGQLASMTLPAAGGLKAETVTTNFDAANMPEWLSSGAGWGAYVAASVYSPLGEPLLYDLGNTYSNQVAFAYEDGTRRLSRSWLAREGVDGFDRDVSYTYDDAGNPTSVIDRPTVAGALVDAQCYTYDGLRRLTQAWTPANGQCATTPSVAAMGGPAPYWLNYSYDGAGNRTSDVVHTAKGDRTTDYDLGYRGGLPHAVGLMTVTGPGIPTTPGIPAPSQLMSAFMYDASGNTTSRPDGRTGRQSLTWDAEGLLESVRANGKSKADWYVYDAQGSRLMRYQGDTTTVYLPGGQELTAKADGSVSAVRYYTFNGTTVAVRTGPKGSDVTSVVPDPQGTSEIAITNVTNVMTQRRDDPFGYERGAAPTSWPADRGFLNKPKDTTGLVQMGARYYDPLIGRFLSVDPAMDLSDPQQWAAYSYANNNPIT